MRLRHLFLRTVALCTLTFAPAFATAAGPTPADATFTNAQPVGVLPILTTGSRVGAYQRFAAFVERGEDMNGVLSPTDFVKAGAAESGFGFAGHSTDADIAIMRYAFVMGGVPAISGDAAQLAEVIATLDGSREVLAPLGPDVVAAVDQFIASAKRGDLDAGALARAMQAAEDGIARGPARAHGYFAAGTWLGLTMLAVNMDTPDQSFLAMAGPLAVMLDEDAEFGGSDQTIASGMRRLAAMLGQGQVNMSGYKQQLSAVFTVAADVK